MGNGSRFCFDDRRKPGHHGRLLAEVSAADRYGSNHCRYHCTDAIHVDGRKGMVQYPLQLDQSTTSTNNMQTCVNWFLIWAGLAWALYFVGFASGLTMVVTVGIFPELKEYSRILSYILAAALSFVILVTLQLLAEWLDRRHQHGKKHPY